MIHPTAIIHPSACLGRDVVVGPYATIGEQVTLGDRVKVDSMAQIKKFTRIGADCVIHSFAVLGGEPQALFHQADDETWLEVGERSVFHEYVTVSRGTLKDQGVTRIGSDCLLMAYSHVGHDCVIADHVTCINYTGLAGHVQVDERAIIGGYTGVKQFCRIGALAMTLSHSAIRHDVLPFTIVSGGEPEKVAGLNLVGLKRSGMDQEKIRQIKKLYTQLFLRKGGFQQLSQLEPSWVVDMYQNFVNSSRQGVVTT